MKHKQSISNNYFDYFIRVIKAIYIWALVLLNQPCYMHVYLETIYSRFNWFSSPFFPTLFIVHTWCSLSGCDLATDRIRGLRGGNETDRPSSKYEKSAASYDRCSTDHLFISTRARSEDQVHTHTIKCGSSPNIRWPLPASPRQI